MKTSWFILLCLLQLTVSAQEKFRKEITGKLALKIFSKDMELKQWFLKEYESYHPVPAVAQQLRQQLKDKTLVVVLGTWCSDSQREFPRLMKVLDEIQFPHNQVKIYGVNRKKTIPAKIVAAYKIIKVPTVILLNKNGTEKGRIVEEVKTSIEEDLSGF